MSKPANFLKARLHATGYGVTFNTKGCTTFNGQKLLLLKRRWTIDVTLAPHRLGDDHIVMARLEPNDQGWVLAKLCAVASANRNQ